MGIPTNTYQTFQLRGNAEDVDNSIYNLDPEETPFASSLSSEKVEARTPQWQEDTLASASANNAMIEGDDFSGLAITPTFILTNVVQTMRKDIVTSGLANAIKKYGRKNEQQYQLAKATIDLRKDVEAAMLSANAGVAGATGTASKMAGLELYANVNKLHNGTGATPASVNATLPTVAPTDGATRALTDTLFNSLLAMMWESGATPKVCYLSMTQKAVVNTFQGIATRRVDVPPRGMASIIGVADIYVWETGPIAFVPVYADRIRSRTLFVTDGRSVKRGFIRGITKETMGKTGDNSKDMLVTDVLVKVTNRKGVGKIAELA